LEPLLGGLRRAGIDEGRMLDLLMNADPAVREAHLEQIIGLGQGPAYAEALARIIPPYARRKAANWAGSFVPAQRILAMKALSTIGGSESLIPLLSNLDDADYGVREQAAETLVAVVEGFDRQDESIIPVYRTLIRALGTLKLSARKVAASLLAKGNPDYALGPLLDEGLTAGDWATRRETAWVLGSMGDIRATRRLAALLDDPSSAVRASVAWALGELDAPPAAGPLIQAYQREPDDTVRATLIDALGKHAARANAQGEDSTPTLNTVIAALDDRELTVRMAALERLAASAVPEARIALHSFRKRAERRR
jgi:HEAT repeat protein